MTGQANRNLRQSAAPEVKRQAIAHRIDHGARINHDNRTMARLTCPCEGPVILVMRKWEGCTGYLTGALANEYGYARAP